MSGERRRRGTRTMDPERPCLNCGDPTPGEYCPTCGQRKVVVQASVRTLVMDVLEDQFILDKRLPRTLGTLLLKPGYMTVEHVNGRVVRYIHPFRLYLVTSLIFFLLLSFFSLRLVRRATSETGGAAVAMVVDSTGGGVASLDSALAQIDEQMADTTTPPVARATLRATRSQIAEQRAELLGPGDSAAVSVARDSAAAQDNAGLPGADSVADEGAEGRDTTDAAARAPDTLGAMFGWDDNPPEVSVGIQAADSALVGRIQRLGGMTPREAAETLTNTFFNYAPTLMFILLPLFAVVLKLLYFRSRRYYAEHFVFLLHVHSFVFLLATIMLVLGNWVGGWLETLLGLWMLAYIYLAMLRVYRQGWLKTFVKYWTLGWTYFWILTFSIPFAFVATLLLF